MVGFFWGGPALRA